MSLLKERKTITNYFSTCKKIRTKIKPSESFKRQKYFTNTFQTKSVRNLSENVIKSVRTLNIRIIYKSSAEAGNWNRGVLYHTVRSQRSNQSVSREKVTTLCKKCGFMQ